LAGARALRRQGLQIAPGSTFALCYNGIKQGRDREVRGDVVSLEDQEWLDRFEAGAAAEARGDRATAEREYTEMADAFEAELLDEYGGLGGGDFEICPDDEGDNLSFLI
jgi:hypothetical protein